MTPGEAIAWEWEGEGTRATILGNKIDDAINKAIQGIMAQIDVESEWCAPDAVKHLQNLRTACLHLQIQKDDEAMS